MQALIFGIRRVSFHFLNHSGCGQTGSATVYPYVGEIFYSLFSSIIYLFVSASFFSSWTFYLESSSSTIPFSDFFSFVFVFSSVFGYSSSYFSQPSSSSFDYGGGFYVYFYYLGESSIIRFSWLTFSSSLPLSVFLSITTSLGESFD